MRLLTDSPLDWRPIRLAQYFLSQIKFRLYGVRVGRRPYARGVVLLNKGTIEIGERCVLVSRPNRSSELVNLRTYFPRAVIRIGDRARLAGATIHCNCAVSIGPQSRLGPGVILCDNDSHRVARSISDRAKEPAEAPIVLEENVWLGMRCIVLKGVTIGQNTIVAAGSVVTRSLPPNVLAGGVPAKVIRSLD